MVAQVDREYIHAFPRALGPSRHFGIHGDGRRTHLSHQLRTYFVARLYLVATRWSLCHTPDQVRSFGIASELHASLGGHGLFTGRAVVVATHAGHLGKPRGCRPVRQCDADGDAHQFCACRSQ